MATHNRRKHSRGNRSGAPFLRPSIILLFSLLLVYLLDFPGGSEGVAIGTSGQGEILGALPQQQEENAEDTAVTEAGSLARLKRSKEAHFQLCGYRLLDALRTVCDRNFVEFSKRSDPTFLGNNNDQDLISEGNPGSREYALSGNPNLDPNSITGYLELLPEHPYSVISSLPFPWRTGRNLGEGMESSKQLAMGILAQSPQIHQRFRRKIVEECCMRPCPMDQMRKYCAIKASSEGK